jgi:hypothetical protein
MRAPGWPLRYGASVALAAGADDVVKGDRVVAREEFIIRVTYLTARFLHFPYGYVAGDEGIRDTGEPSMKQVNIGTTDLTRNGTDEH